MANNFCSKCGKEVAAGKRFCGGCGHAMPVAAAAVCLRCGAALVAGKKFCKQCGHAVGEVAVVAESAQVSVPVPVAESTATPKLPEAVAPVAAVFAPVEEPEIAFEAELTPESDSTSKWEFVDETEQPPAFSAETPYEPEQPAEPEIIPDAPSKTKLWLAIGVAAAVLLAAGGGWAWYAHAHPTASQGAEQVAIAPPPAAGMTVEPTKPPASTTTSTGTSVVTAPINPPQRVESDKPREIAPEKRPDSHPPQVIPPPVVALPQVAQGRSGVRHYNGPPVAHGGTVVFDNLPKARLKFTFDHTAWQLTIKPNPDGTKKVTLNSLAQGYQPRCDLGWEIVE
jgi:hypothetical protein